MIRINYMIRIKFIHTSHTRYDSILIKYIIWRRRQHMLGFLCYVI